MLLWTEQTCSPYNSNGLQCNSELLQKGTKNRKDHLVLRRTYAGIVSLMPEVLYAYTLKER